MGATAGRLFVALVPWTIVATALLVAPAGGPTNAQQGAGGDGPAAAPDAPAAATATARAPARKSLGTVKIDIVEKVEDKEGKQNVAAYFIRKKLQELGFDAYSVRPIPVDRGRAPPPPAGEPDLVIAGTVAVKLYEVSTFYGKEVAYTFEGTGDLRILGKDQSVLATVVDSDRWGRGNEEVARRDALKRIALFLSGAVLKTEPIQARLDEKGKRAVETYVAGLQAKRNAFAEREGGEEDGE